MARPGSQTCRARERLVFGHHLHTDPQLALSGGADGLYSRKIVGWAMAPNMPAELVCDALQLAIGQRRPKPGLMVHSDRGSQYASAAYSALLSQHGFQGQRTAAATNLRSKPAARSRATGAVRSANKASPSPFWAAASATTLRGSTRL